MASPWARSLSAEAAAASGATLSRVTQCVSSSRSCRMTTGSAPESCISPSAATTPAASPRMVFSNSSSTRLRSARPSMSRTCAASTTPPPWAIAWSSMREAVAHRAVGGAGDQGQRLGRDLDLLGGGDACRNASISTSLRHALEVEALAAAEHGHRHLADLGGGEQELHMRRRLFQRLEQRVERLLRQHVHFVDDVDLVARRHRAIAHALDELAHVVDAGAARPRPSRSRRRGGPR